MSGKNPCPAVYKRSADDSMWIVDYDALLGRPYRNFWIFGGKDTGKTRGMTDWLWMHTQKKGRPFVFARRRPEQVEANRLTMWVDHFRRIGANLEIRDRRGELQIRDRKPLAMTVVKKGEEIEVPYPDKLWNLEHPWQLFGFAASISDTTTLQGRQLTDYQVDTIFYDEWMIYDSDQRYISGEGRAVQTLIQNTFRHKNPKLFPCRTIACSNAGYVSNPIFSTFHVKQSDFADGQIFVERGDNLFIHLPPSGNIGERDRLFSDDFVDFAADGNFLDASGDLVCDRPSGAQAYLGVMGERGERYMIRIAAGPIYWMERSDRSYGQIYALSRGVTSPAAVFDRDTIAWLWRVYDARRLWFDSDQTREMLLGLRK